MSKKQGMFRRMADSARRLMGRPVFHDDPVLVDPRLRKKKRAHGHGSGRWRPSKVAARAAMSCDPGTIRYHDRLVRHFGRKKAEEFGRLIQKGDLHLLPSDEGFRVRRPFGWVKPHL